MPPICFTYIFVWVACLVDRWRASRGAVNYATRGKVSCRFALWRTAAECHLKLSVGPLNH
jgi:hypothetical protein